MPENGMGFDAQMHSQLGLKPMDAKRDGDHTVPMESSDSARQQMKRDKTNDKRDVRDQVEASKGFSSGAERRRVAGTFSAENADLQAKFDALNTQIDDLYNQAEKLDQMAEAAVIPSLKQAYEKRAEALRTQAEPLINQQIDLRDQQTENSSVVRDLNVVDALVSVEQGKVEQEYQSRQEVLQSLDALEAEIGKLAKLEAQAESQTNAMKQSVEDVKKSIDGLKAQLRQNLETLEEYDKVGKLSDRQEKEMAFYEGAQLELATSLNEANQQLQNLEANQEASDATHQQIQEQLREVRDKYEEAVKKAVKSIQDDSARNIQNARAQFQPNALGRNAADNRAFGPVFPQSESSDQGGFANDGGEAVPLAERTGDIVLEDSELPTGDTFTTATPEMSAQDLQVAIDNLATVTGNDQQGRVDLTRDAIPAPAEFPGFTSTPLLPETAPEHPDEAAARQKREEEAAALERRAQRWQEASARLNQNIPTGETIAMEPGEALPVEGDTEEPETPQENFALGTVQEGPRTQIEARIRGIQDRLGAINQRRSEMSSGDGKYAQFDRALSVLRGNFSQEEKKREMDKVARWIGGYDIPKAVAYIEGEQRKLRAELDALDAEEKKLKQDLEKAEKDRARAERPSALDSFRRGIRNAVREFGFFQPRNEQSQGRRFWSGLFNRGEQDAARAAQEAQREQDQRFGRTLADVRQAFINLTGMNQRDLGNATGLNAALGAQQRMLNLVGSEEGRAWVARQRREDIDVPVIRREGNQLVVGRLSGDRTNADAIIKAAEQTLDAVTDNGNDDAAMLEVQGVGRSGFYDSALMQVIGKRNPNALT